MLKSFPIQLLLLTFILIGCSQPNQVDSPRISIIPEPLQVISNEGQFNLNNKTKLVYNGIDAKTISTIKSINNFISETTTLKLDITDQIPESNYILFQLNNETSNAESYQLAIHTNHITIKAPSLSGLFYGIQSFKQLLFDNTKSKKGEAVNVSIPAITIKDSAMFKYRGLNLDVARHFYPIDFIKKQIDLMAYYKLNVFHWHLTDDQGWRIEIKKYPKLTALGATRTKTLIGHGSSAPFKFDNKIYTGYYTQNEIKDVVAYAQERHVTIIPEIEMPGHSLAALAAYPELACKSGPFEVANRWGGFDDVMCAGKESTYVIIEDILTEVASLFPGQYIHIGGDDCSDVRWRECPNCQQKIKNHSLNNENGLKHYFVKRVKKIVEKLDKNMVGWGEILSHEKLEGATVIMWQDDININSNNLTNNKIVKSSNNHLYFDHYQSDPKNHPLAIGGYTPLKDVYQYNPLSDISSPQELQSIIGTQANCWTEYMPTQKQVEYMLYPRLLAFSEISWAPQNKKNWPVFRQKVESHLKHLKTLGVNHFYEVPKPVTESDEVNFIKTTSLKFQSVSDDYSTYYTTDGSVPSPKSTIYNKPLVFNQSGTVKAITVNNKTGEMSQTAIINLNKLNYFKPTKVKTNAAGLKYDLYTGRFKTVKEIKNVNKNRTGILTTSYFPASIPNESFGLIFSGYFNASHDGIYHFALSSDDGSALFINKALIVNNDGIHGTKREKGAVALRKGLYPITIYYFQTTGKRHLNISVTKPDNTHKNLIPLDYVN